MAAYISAGCQACENGWGMVAKPWKGGRSGDARNIQLTHDVLREGMANGYRHGWVVAPSVARFYAALAGLGIILRKVTQGFTLCWYLAPFQG